MLDAANLVGCLLDVASFLLLSLLDCVRHTSHVLALPQCTRAAVQRPALHTGKVSTLLGAASRVAQLSAALDEHDHMKKQQQQVQQQGAVSALVRDASLGGLGSTTATLVVRRLCVWAPSLGTRGSGGGEGGQGSTGAHAAGQGDSSAGTGGRGAGGLGNAWSRGRRWGAGRMVVWAEGIRRWLGLAPAGRQSGLAPGRAQRRGLLAFGRCVADAQEAEEGEGGPGVHAPLLAHDEGSGPGDAGAACAGEELLLGRGQGQVGRPEEWAPAAGLDTTVQGRATQPRPAPLRLLLADLDLQLQPGQRMLVVGAEMQPVQEMFGTHQPHLAAAELLDSTLQRHPNYEMRKCEDWWAFGARKGHGAAQCVHMLFALAYRSGERGMLLPKRGVVCGVCCRWGQMDAARRAWSGASWGYGACIQVRACVSCAYLYVHARVCVFIRMCTLVPPGAVAPACRCVRVCACLYVHARVCVYMHVHIGASWGYGACIQA